LPPLPPHFPRAWRRQATLERYRQQYELEHGDDEVFEAGEDKVDNMECEKNEQQKQQPIDTVYYRRWLEYELAHGIAKETDDFSVEVEIDQQPQQKWQKLV